jgi:hypothetical protein
VDKSVERSENGLNRADTPPPPLRDRGKENRIDRCRLLYYIEIQKGKGDRLWPLVVWFKPAFRAKFRTLQTKLSRLLATSSDPVQRYALDWLKDKMQYASPIRKFRESLEAAVRELERLEIIAKGRIEDSTKGKPQLVLWLQPSV